LTDYTDPLAGRDGHGPVTCRRRRKATGLHQIDPGAAVKPSVALRAARAVARTAGVIDGSFTEGTSALPMPEKPSHVTRNARW